MLGQFAPPSQPGARVPGSVTTPIQLADGSERPLEASLDIRGGDRVEILLRRQFGPNQALPLWHGGAQGVPDPATGLPPFPRTRVIRSLPSCC